MSVWSSYGRSSALLGAGLPRLGTGAATVAIRNDDLMHQRLVEVAAEDRVGDRQLVVASNDGKFHLDSPQPLLVGRTMTLPPGAPGTAPRIAIRPRSASTLTTSRPCVVCCTAPM